MNLRLSEQDNQIIVRSEQQTGNILKLSRNGEYVVVEINGVTFSISRRDIPRFVSLLQMAAENSSPQATALLE